MTSPKFNARKAQAQAEMKILDALPAPIRAAINEAGPVRASVVRDALLRGVSEEVIIETIKRSQSK